MRFYESRVEAGRNFLNKVWNATRFILMNDTFNDEFNEDRIDELNEMKLEDKWIISKLNVIVKEVNSNIEKYELGIALEKIQKFVWEEFCDWYIEFKKNTLYNGKDSDKKNAIYILKYVLLNSLKLLHPFCPFITEEIYDNVYGKGLLITNSFPEYKDSLCFVKEEQSLEYIKNVISAIRNRRAEMNVPKDKKPELIIIANNDETKQMYILCEEYIKSLALVSGLSFIDKIDSVNNYVSLTFENSTVYIPFNELVDLDKERERIKAEIKKIEFEINRAKGMLANEKFVSKAPKQKIDEEKEKLKKYEQMLIDLNDTLVKL